MLALEWHCGPSGDKFISFSKTGEWGRQLYADLVAPTLQANLLAETWIRGSRIASNCTGDYFVKNIESLSFPSQDFKETQDHSKVRRCLVCSAFLLFLFLLADIDSHSLKLLPLPLRPALVFRGHA